MKINFVSRSGCCGTQQSYIRNIISPEREQAARNVNSPNIFDGFDWHTFLRHRSCRQQMEPNTLKVKSRQQVEKKKIIKTFAYRPFRIDIRGSRTMSWPSTLGCHPIFRDEKMLGDLLIAVIRVSNGTVRRQAIRSADPVHPVLATSWSNKGCWTVMSCRDLGAPDCCKNKKKSFLIFSTEFYRQQPHHERSVKETLRMSVIDDEV